MDGEGVVLLAQVRALTRERDEAYWQGFDGAISVAERIVARGFEENRVVEGVLDELRALKGSSTVTYDQPPAQQDDKLGDNDSWTGPETSPVSETGTQPARATPSPAPFDIERRARGLFPEKYHSFGGEAARDKAIALAREAQQATLEKLRVALIRARADQAAAQRYREADGLSLALTIVDAHARPPQPAPETTEERYRKALEEIRIGTTGFPAVSEINATARRALEKP